MVQFPLVSVIVINHNYGRYLADCLASVQALDYPSLECMVVDNASDDESREVIETFRSQTGNDDRRRYEALFLDENIHQIRAGIEGYRQCRGDYIVFLDADDFLLPGAVTCHMQVHTSVRRGIAFTCGDMLQIHGSRLVTKGARGIGRFLQSKAATRAELFASDLDLPSDALGCLAMSRDLADRVWSVDPASGYGWPWSATSAFCFRREAVELMFRRTPELRGSLDGYLAHGLNSLFGSVVIDRALAGYRIHADNIFAKSAPMAGLRDHLSKDESTKVQTLATSVISTHLHNLDVLAATLEQPSAVFDAIDGFSVMAVGADRPGRASAAFALDILERDYARLADLFGEGFVKARIRAHLRQNASRTMAVLGSVTFRRRVP